MKNKKLNLFFGIIILILSFSINSCGARKTDKFRASETVNSDSSVNSVVEKKEESTIKTEKKVVVDDKDETVTEETIYEPSDATKPASIIDENGKETVLNNAKKTTRKTTKKNNTKTDNSTNSEEFHKTELKELKNIKVKVIAKKASKEIHVDKKEWSPLSLLWWIIPGVIVFWLFKKYKDKMWWV